MFFLLRHLLLDLIQHFPQPGGERIHSTGLLLCLNELLPNIQIRHLKFFVAKVFERLYLYMFAAHAILKLIYPAAVLGNFEDCLIALSLPEQPLRMLHLIIKIEALSYRIFHIYEYFGTVHHQDKVTKWGDRQRRPDHYHQIDFLKVNVL